MLVRVVDVELRIRHVHLPERCAACGAPTSNGVNEINLTDAYLDGALISLDDAAEPEPLATFEPNEAAEWSTGDMAVATGYRCARCHAVLVAGELAEVEVD